MPSKLEKKKGTFFEDDTIFKLKLKHCTETITTKIQ